MLSLHTTLKRKLTVVLFTAVILPTLAIAAYNILKTNGVFAVDYPMPAGFNDQVFYNCVVERFKLQFPDEPIAETGLTDEQLAMMTNLVCNGSSYATKIADATGLEKMTNLTYLDLRYNNLVSVNLAGNTKLEALYLLRNNLTSLDITNNTALKTLNVNNNQLTTLNLSNNNSLTEIYVSSNQLASLDVSNDPALTQVTAESNQISNLNTTNDTALTKIAAYSNQLSAVDLSTNTALTSLDIRYNHFTELDLSGCTNLEELRASSNYLASLNLNGLTKLKRLYAVFNSLPSLDISTNVGLEDVQLGDNNLTSFDAINNTSLKILKLDENEISSLFLPSTATLATLVVNDNHLSTLNVSSDTELSELTIFNNQLSNLDVSQNRALKTLSVHGNNLSEMDITENIALTTFRADNIPVKMNITALEDSNGFSFSNLGFLKNTQSIPSTSTYEYNSGSRMLSIIDNSTYTNAAQITSSANGLAYQVELPMVVKYDSNGGVDLDNKVQVCYPEMGATTCGTNVTGEEPTYDIKHKFLGWATTADAHVEEYKAGTEITIQNTQELTLYAVWAPVYTLSYDTNGGEGDYAEQSCYNDEDITMPCTVMIADNEPTYENHVFLGWATNPDAETGEYQAGGEIVLGNDTTLTAMWGVKYTLNYDLAGYAEQSCEADNSIATTCSITISEVEPTAGAYQHFLGWGESAEATVGAHQPGEVIAMNENKTLYPKFTVKHYLYYNMNGAEQIYIPQFCVGESTESTACGVVVNEGTPTRVNSEFLGWSTNPGAETGDILPGADLALVEDNTNLNAIWSGAYILTYDLNGGSGSIAEEHCNTGSAGVESCVLNISSVTPEREGYFFLGWRGSDNHDYAVGDEITMTNNVTLTAQWAVEFSLKYDLWNGNGDFQTQTCHGDTVSATSCQVTISEGTPWRSYMYFMGWSESSIALTASYQPGDTITLSSSITLFARWAKEFKLRYDTAEGSGDYEDSVCHGATTQAETCDVTISEVEPTHDEHHEFLGWGNGAEATTASYQPGETITLDNDLLVKAIWGVKFTLSYDTDGGSGTFPAKSCTADNNVAVTCDVDIYNYEPMKGAHKHFLGWATSPSAKTGSYQKGEPITLSDDTTLYARWTIHYQLLYQMTGQIDQMYYPAGTSCNGDDIDSTECMVELYFEGPTSENRVFQGWDTDSVAMTAVYQPQDFVILKENVTNIYAVWKVSYALSYDVNGGTGTIGSGGCLGADGAAETCEAEISTNQPTREGYGFLGWAKSADATTAKYQSGGMITLSADTRLYAVWGKKNTISYDKGGEIVTVECVASSTDSNKCKIKIEEEGPEEEGKEQIGWSTNPNAETGEYKTGDEVEIDGDETVYPIYALKFVITVNPNYEGAGESEVVKCVAATVSSTNCTLALPKDGPTREGYKLMGWANTAGATEVEYGVGDSITVDEDVTLYAVWQVVPEGDDDGEGEESKEGEDGDIVVPNTGEKEVGTPEKSYIVAIAIGVVAAMSISIYIVNRMQHKKRFFRN